MSLSLKLFSASPFQENILKRKIWVLTEKWECPRLDNREGHPTKKKLRAQPETMSNMKTQLEKD